MTGRSGLLSSCALMVACVRTEVAPTDSSTDLAPSSTIALVGAGSDSSSCFEARAALRSWLFDPAQREVLDRGTLVVPERHRGAWETQLRVEGHLS